MLPKLAAWCAAAAVLQAQSLAWIRNLSLSPISRPYPTRQDKAAARAALLEWVDEDVLPAEYGGTSQAGIYDNELEQRFWAHVASKTAGGGDSSGGNDGAGGGDSELTTGAPGTPPAGG